MNKSQRYAWADNTKALGIFLVFLGHFIEPGRIDLPAISNTYKAIYSFHIPLFFILSGFFYRESARCFGELLVAKIKTRLVPVLFFVGLALLLGTQAAWWEGSPLASSASMENLPLLLQGKPVPNWPCWFLVCLFVVELIASELIPVIKTRLLVYLALPVIYAIGYFETNNLARMSELFGFVANWWFVQEAVMALFFYVFGYALAQYAGCLLPSHTGKGRHVVFIVSLLTLLATFRLNFNGGFEVVNMSASSHGDWKWFLITSLAGSLMLMHLSSYIPQNRLLNYIGNNTLPLMGLNGLFLYFFNYRMWQEVVTITNGPLLLGVSILISVISVLAALPMVYLLTRILPFAMGKWK